MKKKSFLTRVFCGMALAMAALPSAWGQAYINTDITGPDFHITNITPDVMTFTAPFSMSFGGGRLTMKDDPSTTASITLKLYSGSPAGTLLASKTLTHTEFCAQVGNCGSFDIHTFTFASPVLITSGQTYAAVLETSGSSTDGFHIKDDGINYTFTTQTGGTLLPDLTITQTISPNPVIRNLTGTLTAVVSNSGVISTTGTVTATVTIPSGWTNLSVTASGWTCGTPTAGATLSCSRGNALNPGASYPSIVVTGTVPNAQTSPLSVTGTVSGGGETNTSNNSSTASVNVITSYGTPTLGTWGMIIATMLLIGVGVLASGRQTYA